MAILEIHRVQLVQRRSLKFCLVSHWLVFVLEDPAGSWRILKFYVVLLYGKSLEGFCRCSRVRGLCLKLVAGLFAWFGSEGSQRNLTGSALHHVLWFVGKCLGVGCCMLLALWLHVSYGITILKPKTYALDRQPKSQPACNRVSIRWSNRQSPVLTSSG